MKQLYLKKTIALAVAGAIVLTGCTGARAAEEKVPRPAQEIVEETVKDKISTDKTVYVITDADGNTQKVMATDRLVEAFGEQKDDNKDFVMTDIDGKEIVYGGSYNSAVPVGVKIFYTLDGEEIDGAQLEGKTGHVKIRIEYVNNAYETRNIRGRTQNVYVPFAMISGVVLDGDVFSDITVKNAKIIENDGKTIVAGIGMPGLSESLDIKDADNSLDYIEIEANAKNFKLDNIYTAATAVSLEDIKTGKVKNKLNDLYGSMDELNDAMAKLTDGSDKLYNGTVTLKNGSYELYTGLNTLASNNNTLNGGAETVFNTLLSTVATQVRGSGLQIPDLTIGNYQEVLKATIASLDKDAVYATAEKEVRAVIQSQYMEQIVQAVTDTVRANVRMQVRAAVNERYTQQITQLVTENVEANTETVKQQVTLAVKANVERAVKQSVLESKGLTEEMYAALDSRTKAAIDAAIEGATEQQMRTEEIKATIDEKTEEQKQLLISQNVQEQLEAKRDEIDAVIESKTEEQMSSDEVKRIIEENVDAQVDAQVENYIANSPEIQEKFAQARRGIVQLQGALAQLDSYNQFYTGLKTYTRSVRTARDGAKKIADGSAELSDGAKELSDGIRKLNDEGIQKLINTVNTEIRGSQDRFNAVKSIAEDYYVFDDVAGEKAQNVKYIFTTQSTKY